MDNLFYISAAVAVVATVMVITRRHAVHALLYLVISLLASATVFYAMGASFVAALEVIIYAGAIMVLFVFVIMMLNLGSSASLQERQWLRPTTWIGPSVLTALLLGTLLYTSLAAGESRAVIIAQPAPPTARSTVPTLQPIPQALPGPVEPQEVGRSLFQQYALGVELASMLLLAAVVGVIHLARPNERNEEAQP